MKRKWIPIVMILGVGVIAGAASSVISIASRVDYDVLSYSVRFLDSNGVTFRVIYAITNPSRVDLDVWNQSYDVYVSGNKVSEVTSRETYKLAADTTSQIPLDIHLSWQQLRDKVPAFSSLNGSSSINDLPVVIKGRLSAKLGVLRLSRIPVRAVTKLGYLIP